MYYVLSENMTFFIDFFGLSSIIGQFVIERKVGIVGKNRFPIITNDREL
jgi:hypothetical protein